MSARESRTEAGSSTILALGVIAVLLTTMIAGLAVLSAVRAAHAARSAADLAALAGAGVYQERFDADSACVESGRIARRHQARIVGCEVGAGGEVSVTISLRIDHRLAGVGPDRAEGRARAGPDRAPDPDP